VQIDAPEAVSLRPLQDRRHHLPRHATAPEFRLGIYIENHGALGARIMWIRRPRREQHASAASHAPRTVNRKPVPVGTIGQSSRQPWTRYLHHPIKFFRRPLSHVAKHRPPVMKDDCRLARRGFSNFKFSLRHVSCGPFIRILIPTLSVAEGEGLCSRPEFELRVSDALKRYNKLTTRRSRG
jgi:hypothetical protein